MIDFGILLAEVQDARYESVGDALILILMMTTLPRIRSGERLSLTSDGRVLYRLRRPWKDGTASLIFEPQDFISKLLPLISRDQGGTFSCQ